MKVYVARQPIFDNKRGLYAYELLYRDSAINSYNRTVHGNTATRRVISDVMTTFGLKNITNGRLAFVNFTQDLLLCGLPLMLNPNEVVIEILESVQPDDKLVECVKKLKERGFVIAIDDYKGENDLHVLFEYVDIIKVDFGQLNSQQRTSIVREIKALGKIALAEKVESQQDYINALNDGYDLFQGYYFACPTVLSHCTAEIAASTRMRILREVSRPDPAFDKLAEIVRLDVNMTYKLLRRINTLEYYRRSRVTSVNTALIRMGIAEIRRWFMLIMLRDVAGSSSDEIIRLALVRGVFAEKITQELGMFEMMEDAFTLGMFSVIDVIMEENMQTLMEDLFVTDEVKEALLGEKNLLGDILSFVCDYESGRWVSASAVFGSRIDMSNAANLYVESINYADLAFDGCLLMNDFTDTTALMNAQRYQ